MKKEYMKPAMSVVELQHKRQLLQVASDPVQGNALRGGYSDEDYDEKIIR